MKKRSRRSVHLASCALIENLESRQLLSTYVVLNTADTGVGSLRAAITNAEENPAAASITFDPAAFPSNAVTTINLTSGPLDLYSNQFTIAGPSGNHVIVNCAGAGFNAFEIDYGTIVEIDNLTISGASAQGPGGGRGAGIDNGGTLTLNDDTISNDAVIGDVGGGIANSGSLTMNQCTLSGDSSTIGGGGLYNAAGGTATITGCTFSDCSAPGANGGAIDNAGAATLSLTDCTITANAAGLGAGIYNDGSLALTYGTIAENSASISGGGIDVDNGSASLTDSIVAGNTVSPGQNKDLADWTGEAVTGSDADDVIGIRGSSGIGGGPLAGTETAPVNPLLGALGNYGGSTQTIPLLPGSPAIDVASYNNNSGVPFDQRGNQRMDAKGLTDAGAFQSAGFFILPSDYTSQSTVVNEPFSQPLQVTITPAEAGDPVAGGVVVFSAPASGASASLSPTTATITADGYASATATANATTGSYTVNATLPYQQYVNGGLNYAAFSLQNLSASLVVNTTGDPSTQVEGVTSLRQAIDEAYAMGSQNPPGDWTFETITFSPTVFPAGQMTTIDLRGALLLSGSNVGLTIQANGQVVLDGQNEQPVAGIGYGGQITLTGLTITDGFSDGSVGGGINNDGTLYLNNCTLSNNTATTDGGAIYCGNGSLLVADDDTFNGNSAADGGVLYVGAGSEVDLNTSTLTGNSASANGGAVDVSSNGKFTAVNATIADNTAGAGGGIYNAQTTSTIDGCIVALNSSSMLPHDDWAGTGAGSSSQNNLLSTAGTSGFTNGVAGNQVGTTPSGLNPLLGPLGVYGGETATLPLLPGSPAIGASQRFSAVQVPYASATPITTDQRGKTLPITSTDIGAFEDQGFYVSLVGGEGGESTTVGTAFTPLQVDVYSLAGDPVVGGVVTFSVPSSGASAILGSPVATIPLGQLTTTTATANSIAGTYQLSVTTRGAIQSDSTELTNTPVTTPTGATVSGTVMGGAAGDIIYLDANNNSILDSGELSTTLTASDTFSFTNVPAGAYIIRQILPSGYTQTSPANGYGIHITVTNGSSLTNENFTDTAPPPPSTGGSVSGTVTGGPAGETIYLDLNNNGSFDSGEPTTTTAANGSYTFTNLPAGAYVIRQALPAGYTQTTPSGGLGHHVTLTAGQSVTGENFTDAGSTPPTGGTVSGTVTGGPTGETIYLDLNNNGTLDSGEPTTTTSAGGAYSFTNLTPGAYVIRQILPSGYTQTTPSGGLGHHITVTNGGSVTGENFTDQASSPPPTGGAVSGTVTDGKPGETIYLDANNNSVLDSGELSTTLSATDTYSFTNVPAGVYIIRQVLPSGYKQTSPSSNYGIHITVTNGGTLTNENFTDTAPASNTASIAGTVFNDANGNGIDDSGETGLAGWTVYLDLSNSGTYQSGDPTATTDSNGDYLFSDLAAGNYIIRVERPSGYTQTSPANNLGHHITVASGQATTGVSFGEKTIA